MATVLCFNSANLISSSLPVSTSRKSSVRTKSSRSPLVTCEDHQDCKVHRRGLLLGGGLAGGLSTADSIHAAPVQAPDMVECDPAIVTKPGTVDTPVKWERCCAPEARGATIEFKKDGLMPMRVRRAAHKLSPDYIQKYNLAYQKMRELDETDPRDPRGFKHQSKVHCAYCNYAYWQQGDDKKLQIHFSWLFLPWHRFYLYFHEKILGSLINDPEFALPFWNWDNPTGGEVIPACFMEKDKYPALYDENRNEEHFPPHPMSLGTGGTGADDNLNVMHQSVAVVKDGLAFLGGVYRKGDRTPMTGNSGSLETVHNNAHVFVGNPKQPFSEDMGNFYTAARDPLFYCHHSNVDRLWTVWKRLGNTDFDDPDFLDTEFLFFDEKKNLVKCKVRDSLDWESNLKYKFDNVTEDNNWISYEPRRNNPKPSLDCGATEGPPSINSTPITVTSKPVVVTVKQPKDSGGKDEVLVLENVTVETNANTRFQVFIDFPTANKQTSLNCMEYVGSFSNVPHFVTDRQAMKRTTNARFSIKYNVEKLNLTGCDKITVTIVPNGPPSFTIQGASIIHT